MSCPLTELRPELQAEAPGAIAVVVGVVLLRLSLLSSIYQRYVKVSARPLLIASGVVLIVLGVLGVVRVRATRRAVAADREGHGHVPAAALLLLLPVVAVFAVAPPALGSYAASRAQTKLLAKTLKTATDLPAAKDGVIPMTLDDFEQRVSVAENLTVGEYGLTGFVTKDSQATQGEFDLTRITIVCCAADAETTTVPIAGVADPPPTDTWVYVVGSEVVVDGIPELQADSLTKIPPPHDPYSR